MRPFLFLCRQMQVTGICDESRKILQDELMNCACLYFESVADANSDDSNFSKGIARVKEMARCASH